MDFLRFYDFEGDRIRFNLLTLDWEGESCTHTLESTPLYPYRRKELESALLEKGFGALEYFGDMHFHPFDEQDSPNLVMVAKKG